MRVPGSNTVPGAAYGIRSNPAVIANHCSKPGNTSTNNFPGNINVNVFVVTTIMIIREDTSSSARIVNPKTSV